MRLSFLAAGAAALALFTLQSEVQARGFGAARGGAVVGPRGAAVGGSRAGVATGPYGGVHAGGAQGGTYVGPRGTTVQAGRAGGVSVGPAGGVHAGGVQGARVTTPGGRTYTTGSAGRAGVGPYGGVHAAGAHGAAVSGPFGGAAAGYRGGVAVGPYGGARGVAVGHATRYVSPAAIRTQGVYVRSGAYYRGYFSPAWYTAHTTAWVAPRWRVANVWVAPAWPSVSVWCGVAGPPIAYDYGSSVVIENNYIYVNGEQTASADEYAGQAAAFADRGREAKPAENEEWQPLGVFGLIQSEEQTADKIFQLAVNKDGVLRGNYYDAVADNTLPVYGSVDPKTQRAAWSIGDKKAVVFEAGLTNLTQDQAPVLVHYGKESTQQMLLVRLEEPPKEEQK
jgi:hypothetical protein